MKNYTSTITTRLKKPSMPTAPSKKMVIGISVFCLLLGSLFLIRPAKLDVTATDTRISAPQAKAQQTINKTFSFPIVDGQGKEVGKISYSIQSAELQNEILLRGQKANAIQGKTFLIISLKLKNEHNQPIELNTRDYMRLLRNNNPELLAADIHNDPVQIQAISTKYTRVAFPINDTDKNLILQVGEINGEKQKIPLNFHK